MQISQDLHLDKNIMLKIATLMLLCLASILSVAQTKHSMPEGKRQVTISTHAMPIKGLNINDVRFDISAKRIYSFKEAIEIRATILNNSIDTIYFLTTTCDGDQYSLRYDTSKFILTPSVYCNASFPRLQKIEPKGQYDFKAHFCSNSKESVIVLGFDFYPVDKSFDLSQISVGKIHNRSAKDQSVLWAKEKTIE
jgi:hypothetical protein